VAPLHVPAATEWSRDREAGGSRDAGRADRGEFPDRTDLARLVVLEFALVHSNDWFTLPCDLPAGTLASLQSLAVTDVFGQRLWITLAGTGDDQDWQRWSMFTLDTIDVPGSPPLAADTSLFLPPTVPKVAEGPVLEEVDPVRDEKATMVWGVEQTVRVPTGEGCSGSEVAAGILAHRLRLFPPEQPSALLGVIDQMPVHPRTAVLREGLDATPVRSYFVHEEVPRTGTKVSSPFNRIRGRDGRVLVWLSARRGAGRSEGSSGLCFDLLTGTRPQP
jgi:hypothetical protein